MSKMLSEKLQKDQRRKGSDIDYKVGTMMEIPRATLMWIGVKEQNSSPLVPMT